MTLPSRTTRRLVVLNALNAVSRRFEGIPTETREEIDQVVRVCQLDLLRETGDWKEAHLLVQKLQNEAREERITQPGGKAEDDGEEANMAVHHSYEKPVRDVVGCCHSMEPSRYGVHNAVWSSVLQLLQSVVARYVDSDAVWAAFRWFPLVFVDAQFASPFLAFFFIVFVFPTFFTSISLGHCGLLRWILTST